MFMPLSDQNMLPNLLENKYPQEVTKLILTEDDLIRYGTGTTKKYWSQK